MKTADGGKQNVIGFLEIPTTYKNTTKKILYYLVPKLKQSVYLGINFWKSFDIAPQLFVSDISLDSETFSNSNIHSLSDIELFELKRVVEEFPAFSKLG